MRNPYFSLLSTAWKYARQEKKRFVVVYAMFIMATTIVAINPLFYGWFINELQFQGADVLRTGWLYIGGFLGLRLLEWCFHGPGRVMERQLAFTLSRNFMEEVYHKILHLPVKWHQDHHSGSTINKLRKAHEALRDFFQNGFIYFYSFGKFFFSFGAMLYFSPLFGAIGVILGIITIWVIAKFDKVFIRSLKEVNEREHEVSSTLFDSLSNIITVITLRLEKRIQATYMGKLMAVYPPFKKNVSVNEWKWFTAQMMVGLIYCVTTIGYLYQHWNTGSTFFIGGLVVLLGYVNQFTSVFNDIAGHYTQIMKFNTELQNVREVEAAYDQMHLFDAEKKLPSHWKTIDIENLNFYRADTSNTQPRVGLHDLSMRIEKGKRIALIGESGCGKSTLLALLRGLFQPQSSTQIRINDSETENFETIANNVTLLPQDPEIFENTILYNITLGLKFNEDEIAQACRAAQFDSVVNKLPNGFETNIQEKGVNLSGGQKQRLALARGILAAKTSDLVLLDEPTSSIDPRTERNIYENLFQAFEGKAIISSLHRLHLLHYFDYVYILKDGFIVDKGTFEELRRSSLVFKELWDHQITEIKSQENTPEITMQPNMILQEAKRA
ncbi:ABC transporter ATP-binding protein [Chryseolinea sp. H1M3-3]|uniref:ABC transporter ATP-binding protein n=1 Tax=Chryseolinea sp. H1M3-3 TaxID=3034144 RepID=UPI0023EB4E2B|nr:ABC transporter ATP-binding protein [Chryseolinea sp. H1M3-3]